MGKKYAHWNAEDWTKVLFSDETHFLVQGQRSKFVRKAANESLSASHINQTVKHPSKKMFWGCFSYSGTGTLIPIEGMMNSEKYKSLLGQRLAIELDKVQGRGIAIFQQDSALCHVSKIMMKYFEDNNITHLD